MTYSRALQLPKQSFFLFGARGVGKTSLLKERMKPALSLEFLSQENYLRYSTDIGLLRRQLNTLDPGNWVWIDEIQKIPELLNEVHWGIEAKKLKFALSGSSARKLRRTGVNLLAGRAISKTLFPFIPSELGSDFDLTAALEFGTLPLVWTAPQKKDTVRAYVHTYLREEVQAEALVKNLPQFARFLKVAALMHAQTMSLSSLARDVGVKRSTVEGYCSIAEDTLLATRLYPFESGTRVKERRHPKWYWIDSGIVRALKEDWGPVHDSEKGPLFEGFVHLLLKSYQAYKDGFDELFYWATSNVEVDFVLKKGRSLCAIEVKSSARFRPEDLSGLRSIATALKPRRRILVYPKVTRQNEADGIEIMGLDDFLKLIDEDALF